jgi:hypothetical protein
MPVAAADPLDVADAELPDDELLLLLLLLLHALTTTANTVTKTTTDRAGRPFRRKVLRIATCSS